MTDRAGSMKAIAVEANAARNIIAAAYQEFKRREKTMRLWTNPLSIYSPDPLKLAVVMFNLSLKERTEDSKQKLKEMMSVVRRRIQKEEEAKP